METKTTVKDVQAINQVFEKTEQTSTKSMHNELNDIKLGIKSERLNAVNSFNFLTNPVNSLVINKNLYGIDWTSPVTYLQICEESDNQSINEEFIKNYQLHKMMVLI